MEFLLKAEYLGDPQVHRTNHGPSILSKRSHPDRGCSLLNRRTVEHRHPLSRTSGLRAVKSRKLEAQWKMVDSVTPELPVPGIVDGESIVVRTAGDTRGFRKPP